MLKTQVEKKKIVVDTESDKLTQCVDAVLRTEAGRVLWAHMFHLCGYNVSSLARKTDGEIAPMATEAKEAQRLVYIRLRKLASRELLAQAEELAENPIAAPIPEEERK